MISNFPWRPWNHSLKLRLLPRHLCTEHLPYQNSSAQQSYMEVSQRFYEAMKFCASNQSIPVARKLHAQLISTGYESSIFLQNHLLNTYSNCGLIKDAFGVFCSIEIHNVYSWNTMINAFADSRQMREAEKLFDEMSHRDTVSWNSMMSGYFHNGQPEDTLKVFSSIIRDCFCVPGPFSFSCAMKACGSIVYLKLAFQIHGLAEKFDLGGDISVVSSILDMYIKCGGVSYAKQVFLRLPNPTLFCWNSMIYGYTKSYGGRSALDLFSQMPERDIVSWNMIISILSQHGFGTQTLTMHIQMWNQGFRPNSMTYASVLSACTSIYDMEWGTHLHARILRMDPNIDVFVGSGLIDMYAKCGCLEYARRVFDSLTEHNVVSWTALIGGFAQFGLEEEALILFNQMREVPVAPESLSQQFLGFVQIKRILLGNSSTHI